jgi:hypothetical protein
VGEPPGQAQRARAFRGPRPRAARRPRPSATSDPSSADTSRGAGGPTANGELLPTDTGALRAPSPSARSPTPRTTGSADSGATGNGVCGLGRAAREPYFRPAPAPKATASAAPHAGAGRGVPSVVAFGSTPRGTKALRHRQGVCGMAFPSARWRSGRNSQLPAGAIEPDLVDGVRPST